MSFWQKYKKYFKMAILVSIYCVVTFTKVVSLLCEPLLNTLGLTIEGYQNYIIIMNVIIYVLLFFLSCVLVPDIYYVDFKIFKKKKPLRKFLELIISYHGFLMCTLIGSAFTMVLGGEGDSINESSINAIMNAQGKWIYLPVVIIIGPIVEEVIFRGIIQSVIIGSKFQKRTNVRVFLGIIISALLFGFIHVIDGGDYIQVFPYLLMGLALGTICYETKSIFVSIIIHIFNNFLACLLTLLGVGFFFLF